MENLAVKNSLWILCDGDRLETNAKSLSTRNELSMRERYGLEVSALCASIESAF